MARLVNPTTGTVVECGGDLEDRYRALGWKARDESSTAEAASEKPATTKPRGRSRKSE